MNARNRSRLISFLAIVLTGSVLTWGTSAAEQSTARDWVASHLSGDTTQLPFSFRLGGASTSETLKRFDQQNKTETNEGSKVLRELSFSDPESGLQVRCVAIEYLDCPVVEWTLYFKNCGSSDTPIISEIQALDIVLERIGDEEFVLHHNKGSRATPTDFHPMSTVIEEGMEVRLRSLGGRGSNGTMPYFNLHAPGQGMIAAVGWPGQWQARFQRDATNKLRVRAGQEVTHFKLLPGEEVRSPLIALLFYDGDALRGQNVWRRWMVRHNLPRVDEKLPPTQLVACSSHQFGEMIHANEENQKLFIDRYLEEKLGIAYWWMDAGWYTNNGQWVNTGTWEVDRRRFPKGLRGVTDHAHAKGLKAIVWFEPERVTQDSWLYDQHPEWLLAPPPNPGDQLYDAKWRLLNLGNPDALAWLIDHVGDLIEDEGIDLYRQDFNVDPLLFWQAHDAPDRQGIAEIKHVTGYLAYWDALRKRHPHLRMDTCASGGRRLDLETLRRAVPLVRSDYLFEPNGQQCHTYGISQWLPYHGTGTLIGKSAIGQNTTDELSSYDFRSHMACSVTACWDMRRADLNYDELRRLTAQMRKAAPNFLGDFYPLTPYSIRPDAWMAWQFDHPEEGTGVVQAFRREGSSESKRTFQLQGLEANAHYELVVADNAGEPVVRRAKLTGSELTLEMPHPRSAALVFYHKRSDKK